MDKNLTEKLPKCLGLAPSNKFNDCVGDEAGDEHDSESVPRFAKAHDTMKLLNYDFTHTAVSNMMNRAF